MRIIIIIGILVFGIFILDIITCKSKKYNGIVVDKHYKEKQNNSYHTYGTDGKMHYTTSNSPEKFLLMCRINNNTVLTTESEASIYYSKNLNDKCIVEITKGGFIGLTYSTQTIR